MKTDKLDELHETTARLGTERLSKLLFRLSAPSIASMVTISLYHLADTFWLGQLSYQAIAAVTITFPFYIALVAIGVGTGVGANAVASRRFGERNIEATNQVAGQIFPLTAVFSVVFIIASVFFARPVATLLGAPQDIVALTADYLFFIGWGVPFILFRLMTRNVFHAAGDAIKPMIFTIPILYLWLGSIPGDGYRWGWVGDDDIRWNRCYTQLLLSGRRKIRLQVEAASPQA
jgi:Na+-driven multidrug efflux pump